MEWLTEVDWRTVLRPDTPVLEIVLRGSLIYLSLFFLLRFVLRREAGGLSVTDLLVIVLIADAAQNAMADDYRAVPDGILLVGVIVFWAWFLDWLAFRNPRLERLLKPPRLPLVREGRLMRRNMRKELITEDELMSQIRLQGVEDVAEVQAAYMEPDGRISVIKRDASSEEGAPGRTGRQ